MDTKVLLFPFGSSEVLLIKDYAYFGLLFAQTAQPIAIFFLHSIFFKFTDTEEIRTSGVHEKRKEAAGIEPRTFQS